MYAISISQKDIDKILEEAKNVSLPVYPAGVTDDVCTLLSEHRYAAIMGVALLSNLYPQCATSIGAILALFDKYCEAKNKNQSK